MLHKFGSDFNVEDIFAYADDIMILCEDLQEVQVCLQSIESWAGQNNLMISKKKSAILEFIHRRARKTILKVGSEIDGYPVVDKYKYLGTWLNQKLTLDDQMEHIVKKTYFIRSKLTPSLFNASLDLRKNLWQIFVVPLYEFALPLYAAENAVTKKEKTKRLLRASFRSYIGLKKTVRLDLLADLMGYNLDTRADKVKYISKQRWRHRLRGELYDIATDTDPRVQVEVTVNMCKGVPKGVIKYINMQASLCPICKSKNIKRQSNTHHINKAHKYNFKTTQQLIQEIKTQTEKLKKEAKAEKKRKPKRMALLEAAETLIQADVDKFKSFLRG